MPGQRHRLTARPAAEVGDQGFVGQVVDETQCLEGRFGTSRVPAVRYSGKNRRSD